MHNGSMATLTLKNVPDDLYQRLKAQAAANRRSLNQEAIECLSSGALLERTAEEAALAIRRVVALQEKLATAEVWIDHGHVKELIEEGRP